MLYHGLVRKLIYVITALLISVLPRGLYAQEQFSADYSILYKVLPDGITEVTQDITITNQESDVVATNYYLTVNQMAIHDITAESAQKAPLQTEVNETTDSTTIKVIFDRNVIGQGKKTQFTINYKTMDLTSKVGEVWSVTIPKVTMLPSTTSYNVVLSIPAGFGPEKFVSPSPTEKIEEVNEIFYKFDMETLKDTGLTASFGEYQVLNFKLKYSLQNPSYFTSSQEIALPPDMVNVQQVAYKSLEPKPHSLKTDQDGNTIAVYRLKGKEQIEVTAIGTARILGQQIKPHYGVKKEQIPADLIKKYTNEDKYWEVNNPQIKEIATKLFDPQISAAENAQNAYSFVINNLTYDFDILNEPYVERKGALEALKSPKLKNGCMEFTDLFISIVRAMGIPAREINGYAFVSEGNTKTPISISLQGGDQLHSWAEFYDTEFGWVPVDPTWGATSGIDYFTKLDTNHFAFSIKGLDSEFPFPAGTYKLDGNEKQVEVDFSQKVSESDFLPRPELREIFNFNPVKVLNQQNRYNLHNGGLSVIYYNDNGARVPVLPGENKYIYLNKGESVILIRDATNNATPFNIDTITVKKSKSSESKELFYVSLTLLATGLCMSFLLLIARPVARKKPLDLLRRRLRGQNQ